MVDNTEYAPEPQENPGAYLRDLEEKQRLLKDRLLLIGKSFIEEREKMQNELQELKKEVLILKEDTKRIKELIERISEQISSLARKEEVAIIQRQLDMLRGIKI